MTDFVGGFIVGHHNGKPKLKTKATAFFGFGRPTRTQQGQRNFTFDEQTESAN